MSHCEAKVRERRRIGFKMVGPKTAGSAYRTVYMKSSHIQTYTVTAPFSHIVLLIFSSWSD